MSKSKLVISLLFFTMLNLLVFQQWRHSSLEERYEIEKMRSEVNNEFLDELIWMRLNDIENLSKDHLVSQGRLEGLVSYLSEEPNERDAINQLWHEGYMRGLAQTEWEHDVISETHYNKGYREAIEKAFPDGNYPTYVNYPPKDVDGSAIGKPEFDSSKAGERLNSNKEVIDALNEKIDEIRSE